MDVRDQRLGAMVESLRTGGRTDNLPLISPPPSDMPDPFSTSQRLRRGRVAVASTVGLSELADGALPGELRGSVGRRLPERDVPLGIGDDGAEFVRDALWRALTW